MVAVKLDDLSMAFEFVGAAPCCENNAYISLDTGEILLDIGAERDGRTSPAIWRRRTVT